MSAEVVGARAPGKRATLGDPILVAEIGQFLAYESELLDDRRYHEWVEIVTDDFTYQVPTPRTPDSPFKPHYDERLLFIDESKWSLTAQWFRRLDPDIYEAAWGENPPVRLRHLVTNIRVRPSDDQQEYEVRSNVALVGTRQSNQPRYLTGERTDRITRRDGVLFLARRWVVLDQVVLDFPQIRVIL